MSDRVCPECSGSGRVYYAVPGTRCMKSKPCPVCRGRGLVKKEEYKDE